MEIGDIISFKNAVASSRGSATLFSLTEVKFFTEQSGIPKHLIKHGVLNLWENKGEIVDKWDGKWIVKFNDWHKDEVQLGFPESELELKFDMKEIYQAQKEKTKKGKLNNDYPIF